MRPEDMLDIIETAVGELNILDCEGRAGAKIVQAIDLLDEACCLLLIECD